MTDLGILPGYTDSYAYRINNAGQVVGDDFYRPYPYHYDEAYLYQNGTMTLLNDLLPDSGWNFQHARGINDAGQIVGTGTNPDGQTHAFLLTPCDGSASSQTSTNVTGLVQAMAVPGQSWNAGLDVASVPFASDPRGDATRSQGQAEMVSDPSHANAGTVPLPTSARPRARDLFFATPDLFIASLSEGLALGLTSPLSLEGTASHA